MLPARSEVILPLLVALSVPAILLAAPSPAEAGIFDIFSESRESGKRRHTRVRKHDEDNDDDTEATRRRYERDRPAPAAGPRPTAAPQPSSSYDDSGGSHHVHDDHHYPSGNLYYPESTYGGSSAGASASYTTPDAEAIDVYIAVGGGLSGLDIPDLSDRALPGFEYRIALGLRGELVGLEIGAEGAGYRFDPEADVNDIGISGITGDLRLQPSLGLFEPYGQIGVGVHTLYDGYLGEGTGGASGRVGFGLEVRLGRVSLGARYLYSYYSFQPFAFYEHSLEGPAESIGITTAFHF